MIDPYGEVADALRTLWIWLLIGPGLAPATGLLPELGYALGVTLPRWVGIALGVIVAGALVGVGERRYGRIVVASLLTAAVWFGAASLLGLADPAVFGALRLVAARFLLWIAAVSLAVALVFHTIPGGRTDDTSNQSRPSK